MPEQAGKTIEFWYEFASTYSYLASARIEAVAQAAGVAVVWRPFLLGPIFKSQGWDDSPFNLYPAKGRYMWRDMERLAVGYGLPFQKPEVFPRNGLAAARIACLAQEEAWCGDFTRAVYAANFSQDLDIGASAVLAGLLETLEQDPGTVMAAANEPENKARLRAQGERAAEIGIFGAPSFVARGELYWGNDRLGDAVAKAALG